MDLGLNERAARIADGMIADATALGLQVESLGGGTRVIDAGVRAPGGLAAGRRLAEACMGGLGEIAFTTVDFGDYWLPGVIVSTDHPAVSCMASQYAGWKIDPEGYFAMGSGPLRAAARVEKQLFGTLGYEERAKRGVLVLETRQLPDAKVAAYVSERAGVSPDGLFLLVAPTASLAGGVQISARVLETALHKMLELEFDIGAVLSGLGTAPLAPVAKDDLRAIGRTNDCVLYGGRAHFTVRTSDEALAEIVSRIPSSASSDYGTPFYEIFKRYDGDFYRIDPHLFSPAEVALTNVASGRTFRAGEVNPAVLRASLLT
ncbi:MAG: methenyltetrahydromethanopterin cyclohydrolase [Gemmatimonadota bacterium]